MVDPREAENPRRPIRSFVVRGGRLTASQREAIDQLWPRFGLEADAGIPDWPAVFGRDADRVLEIGFGMGDSLAQMAQARAHEDFVGIDVHPPGIGTLLREIRARQLGNIRLYQGDATAILGQCFADNSLVRIQVYFPDPWHKKRHHKRRMIQPPFVETMASKIRPGGVLHLATDWENYAEQMLAVMEASPRFENSAGTGNFAEPGIRPETKFERRGRRLGHGVWDLRFVKQA